MISGKRNFTRVATLLLGAGLAISSNLGCGGETGGAPNGIASALTNSTVRVSSFSLTASSASNSFVEVNPTSLSDLSTTPVTPDGGSLGPLQGVAGALYPTRNSHSFRVLLKGAGSNLEDVIYYYDIFDTASNYSFYPNDPTSGISTDGLDTTLTKLFVAPRPDSENPDQTTVDPNPQPSLWPVIQTKDSHNANVLVYADNPTAPVPSGRKVYRVLNAYSYAQTGNKRAVRVGRRNVIVQFFSDTAQNVKSKYDAIAAAGDAQTAASLETSLLTSSLTNTYVFTTLIQPNQAVTLTGAFEANNGDSGLVDTGTLLLKATNLPKRWGSVKFQAFEESYGFDKPSIVFTKIVNLTDGQSALSFGDLVKTLDPLAAVAGQGAPSSVSATLAFANRQRILKVYATCYELPDATGAVLAQTVDRGKYNQQPDTDTQSGFDYTPYEPVVFVPTAEAKPVAAYSLDPSGQSNAATLLLQLKLLPAISNVKPSVPTVAKGTATAPVTQTIKVTADSYVYSRGAYDTASALSLAGASPTKDSRTLSNIGFYFVKASANSMVVVPSSGSTSVYYDNLPNVLADPTAPSASDPGGQVRWADSPVPADFSQLDDANPATILTYTPYYPASAVPPGLTTLTSPFAAPLAYTQGSTSGTIKVIKR